MNKVKKILSVLLILVMVVICLLPVQQECISAKTKNKSKKTYDMKNFTKILPEEMGGNLAETLAKKLFPKNPEFYIPEDDYMYHIGNDAIGIGTSANNDGYMVEMYKPVKNFSIYGVKVGMTQKQAVKKLKAQGIKKKSGVYPTPDGLGDCYITMDIIKGKVKMVRYTCYIGK